VKSWLKWLLLIAAFAQFAVIALPPGNADLISVQSLAFDLRRGDASLLYPGRNFERNDEWVAHHTENLRLLRAEGEPNWCFYPPLLPFVLAPLAGADAETWRVTWGIVQILLVVAFALLIGRLLQSAGVRIHPALLYALVLGSYPVARSVQLGQTSLLMAFLLWSAIRAAQRGRNEQKAVLTGVAAFVKPFLLLAAMPDFFRRRASAALGALAVVALLFVFSLFLVGAAAHIGYWNLLTTLASSQTAYYGNQSLMGGLMRAFSSLPVLDYGFQTDVSLSFFALSLALLVLIAAFVVQRRAVSTDPIAQAGLWLSAVLLALPISWEHHLLLLLPVLALLWRVSRAAPARRVLLMVATGLLEICYLPFYGEGTVGRLAASLPLIGNLMLFVLIARYLLRPNASPSVEAAT
jgi:hypothetical protein